MPVAVAKPARWVARCPDERRELARQCSARDRAAARAERQVAQPVVARQRANGTDPGAASRDRRLTSFAVGRDAAPETAAAVALPEV